MDNSIKTTASPHFWWLIIILGVIILALLTFVVSKRVIDSKDIMDYVSSFALLLSIVLSIFAILYTYTSNAQIQRQFDRINAAANNINEVSTKWVETASQISERLDRVEKRQEELNRKFDNNNPVPSGTPQPNTGN